MHLIKLFVFTLLAIFAASSASISKERDEVAAGAGEAESPPLVERMQATSFVMNESTVDADNTNRATTRRRIKGKTKGGKKGGGGGTTPKGGSSHCPYVAKTPCWGHRVCRTVNGVRTSLCLIAKQVISSDTCGFCAPDF